MALRLQAALLCDHASTKAGLLYVLGGGITQITPPEIPARFRQSVAVVVAFGPDDLASEHAITVRLKHADSTLAELSGTFALEGLSAATDEGSSSFAFGLPSDITDTGPHTIEILLDDRLSETLRFQVLSPPKPARKRRRATP